MASFPPIIIPPTATHTSTIIFLHGLGDTGHGWAEEIADLKPEHSKLICPTAESRAVTMNGGAVMPTWFDLRSRDKGSSDEDIEGILAARALIDSMIEAEVTSGISPNRIIVGGFSQGAALSLYTGLTGKEIGGVICMSGYIPARESIEWDKVLKPHVLMCHGKRDPVVPFEWGFKCAERLRPLLPHFTFKEYENLDHSSSPKEMRDVEAFIKSLLPPI